jgi:signal transduction histidine kinase
VVVEVHSETESAVISVTDNGRGIPPEHIAHIFRPFYTTKGNGTGLGLSLTRRIVEQHRGRIEVTSELGNGTRFQVYLPLREAVLSAVS